MGAPGGVDPAWFGEAPPLPLPPHTGRFSEVGDAGALGSPPANVRDPANLPPTPPNAMAPVPEGGVQGPTFDGRRFVGGAAATTTAAPGAARSVDIEIVGEAPSRDQDIEIVAETPSRDIEIVAEASPPRDQDVEVLEDPAEDPSEAPDEREEAPEAAAEEAAEVPSTPKAAPAGAQARAVGAIASELQCSICCSTAAKCCAAVPCGHVFCRACLVAWLRRKRSCPNCNRPVDPRVAFVEIRALDNVVNALIEASPSLGKRDSVDRRRARAAELAAPERDIDDGGGGGGGEDASGGGPGEFVTAAALMRAQRGDEPTTTRRETSRFLANQTPLTARAPRSRRRDWAPPRAAAATVDAASPIMRSVAGLETPSDISRAVDSLRDLDLPGSRGSPAPSATRPPRAPANTPARSSPSPAATPASTPRRRLSLVDRQRLAAERGAERRAAASPASSDGARWRA